MTGFFHPHHFGRVSGGQLSFLKRYLSWYLFLVAFLVASFFRAKEIIRRASNYDFDRFSLSTGDIHPFFYNFKVGGLKFSVREIETVLEPLAFFIVGLILQLLGQKLGELIIVSSFFYYLSYAGAYKNGDDFVMDRIDEMIMNEEMSDAFVHDNAQNAKGVRFYADKPARRDLRRKVAASMVEKEAVSFAE